MKHWKKGISIFLFCLVLLAGFLFPRTVLHIQDMRLEERIESYRLNNEPLRQSSHLLERMTAMQDEMVELTQVEETMLDSDMVYSLMLNVVRTFGLYPLEEHMVIDWEATPKRMISPDGTLSFIMWDCNIYTQYGDIMIELDDTTGKALAYQEYLYEDWGFEGGDYIENISLKIEDYYGYEWEQVTSDEDQKVYDTDGIYDVVDVSGDSIVYAVKYILKDGEIQADITCEYEKNSDMMCMSIH